MNKKREKWFRYFIYWWMLAFGWAAFIQLFLPDKVASHTSWGMAPGWQREIALWNLGTIAMLFGILKAKIPLTRTVIPGLCFLFLLLGLNHLWQVLQTPGQHGFTIVIMNFIPLLAVSLVLYVTRKEDA